MKFIVRIPIECGKTTCCTKNKVMCKHVLVRRFGTEWICGIFRDLEGREVVLKDEGGWLQRCTQCLNNIHGK